MRTSPLIGLALTLAFSCSAADEAAEEDNRAGSDPEAEKVEVSAEVRTTAEGATAGVFQASIPNTQIIKAPEGSRINGALLRILPGTFDVDFEIRLEEGRSLGSQKNLQLLGYDANTVVQGSGAPVYVFWAVDEAAGRPITVRVPAPAAAGLQSAASATVISLQELPLSDENELIVYAKSKVTVVGAFLEFETTRKGVFQAVLLANAATGAVIASKEEPKVVKTTDPAQATPPPKPGVPPTAFTITGPKKPLNGARVTITWDPSDGVDTYEVKLDSKDAKCATPYKTVPNVKTTSLRVDAVATGTSYVCVTAKNAGGATVATNSGFTFKADAQAPAVPTNVKIERGSSAIEAVCTWDAVTDVGEAGLSHYHVSIGHTAGAADKFTGPVPEATRKAVVGLDGESFFCSVKAVDAVGNESAAAAAPAGYTIDSE